MIQIAFSTGMGLVVNFFILRVVLAKLNKPQDKKQQVRLAAVLSILLAVPSLARSQQLAELNWAELAKV